MKQNRKPGIHLHKTVSRRRRLHDAELVNITEYYWILISKNGKTTARSSEMYKTKRATLRSMRITAEIFTGHKPIEYFDHTQKDGGNWVEF